MYRFVIIVKYLTNFFKLEWNLGIKFTLRFFFLSVYIENITSKNWKFHIKNSDIFHISAHQGGSNEYPQFMFLSRNKKIMYNPCKPQFYYIKVGFKGVNII